MYFVGSLYACFRLNSDIFGSWTYFPPEPYAYRMCSKYWNVTPKKNTFMESLHFECIAYTSQIMSVVAVFHIVHSWWYGVWYRENAKSSFLVIISPHYYPIENERETKNVFSKKWNTNKHNIHSSRDAYSMHLGSICSRFIQQDSYKLRLKNLFFSFSFVVFFAFRISFVVSHHKCFFWRIRHLPFRIFGNVYGFCFVVSRIKTRTHIYL